MIFPQALSEQAVLLTQDLRLEQLNATHFEFVWLSLQDPESMRLTGTQTTFSPEAVQTHLASLEGRNDRADWAILRQSDNAFIGEVVLNNLDAVNQSMNFRIALSVLGQGYGTQATRVVVDYAFAAVGLHRLSLSVFEFNPRAIRVYQKCGFVLEGIERDVLLWDGQWYSQHLMSLLKSDRAI